MQNQRDDIFVWSAVLWGARTKRLCPGGGAAARAVCAAAACGGCRQSFSFSHGRAHPLKPVAVLVYECWLWAERSGVWEAVQR